MSMRRVGAVLVLGFLYFVIGLVFGELAKHGATRFWRLAAWLASGLLFVAHIGFDGLRAGGKPAATALRAAAAAALGAFGVAVAANVHSARLHVGSPRLHLALAVWPVLTAVGAFPVALLAGWVLSPRRRR